MNTLLMRALVCGLTAILFTLAGQTTSTPNSKSAVRTQSTGQGTAPAKPPEVAPAPAVEKPAEVGVAPEKPSESDVPASASAPSAKSIPAQSPASLDSKARARRPYIIGPEDSLMIRVWQEPNLSGPVTVTPDGMISLQLIDEVKADGLTTEQLKAVLTDRLKGFINNPDVNVQMLRFNSRKFILQGEVNRPGSFSLTGPTTLMEALVNGGGFREFANTKKIYVLRTETDPTTNKTETKRFNFNYKEVSHGKHMEQNIPIQNGDQIFVP